MASHAQSISEVLNKRLESIKTQTAKERVFVVTDRDIYSPGEKIWLSAMAYDIFSPSLSYSSASIYVRVYNSDQSEVLGKNFPVVNGVASGSLLLPAGLPEDLYYLKGETSLSGGPGLYFKKILIKQKPIDPFIIEVNVPDQVFGPGEDIPMNITFKDYYNEPLTNVAYQVDFFDGMKKLSGTSGKLKKEMNTALNFKVPPSLVSGVLNYKITAQQKNKEAKLTGQLKVLIENIYVEFYPESGKLIDKIQTTMRFYVYDPSGQPVQASGNIKVNDSNLLSVSSNSWGMGSFSFLPDLHAEYRLQLDMPGGGKKEFPLPIVQERGMVLELNSNLGNNVVTGLIKSSFTSTTPTILIGESNGTIFHLSEQRVENEFPLTIDISKAKDALIHFVLTNSAAEILAEQVGYSGEVPKIGQIEPRIEQKMVRGKVVFGLPDQRDIAIMSAVNQPWISGDLSNQAPWLLGLPYDILGQSIYQSTNFLSGIYDDQLLREYVKYYTPSILNWSDILNAQSAQTFYEIPKLVINNRQLQDKLKIYGIEIKKDDGILHTNMNASSYFITSNPKYIASLYEQKTETIPAYKKMLQNGTPILDVIQSIKPFRLEGSNIVFNGTSNSLLYQGGALIVIDGVNRGTDASLLKNISPFDVDRIFVSTNANDIQRYTGLNSVGLIEIWLKKGEVAEAAPTSEDDDAHFVTLRHDGPKSPVPDYRNTLHWYCGDGKSDTGLKQEYFNSDLLSSVVIQFYFIPKTGIPLVYQYNNKVEPK